MSRPDALDFGRDVPTSADDIAALDAVRRLQEGNWLVALQQLFDALPPQARGPRKSTDAGRPELEL